MKRYVVVRDTQGYDGMAIVEETDNLSEVPALYLKAINESYGKPVYVFETLDVKIEFTKKQDNCNNVEIEAESEEMQNEAYDLK